MSDYYHTINADERVNRAYNRIITECKRICEEEKVEFKSDAPSVDLSFGEIKDVTCNAMIHISRRYV